MNFRSFSLVLIGACLGTWLLSSWFFLYPREILLGMILPLVVGLMTLYKVESIFTTAPAKLTPFMIKSFVVKMVIYGAYIVGIAAFSSFHVRPFFVSFISYFVTLHVLEAFFIRSVLKGS